VGVEFYPKPENAKKQQDDRYNYRDVDGYEILVCFSTQLLNLVSTDSKELTPRIGDD